MGTLGVRLNSNIEKEEPVYSEELIQKVLRGAVLSPSSVLYRTENLNVFAWESDSLAITKSKYAYEFEIKIGNDIRVYTKLCLWDERFNLIPFYF